MKASFRVSVAFLLYFTLWGCASHEIRALNPDAIDTYRNQTKQAGVTVAADSFNTKQKVEMAFTMDLNEQGFVPILLVMENQTADNFHLLKDDIELVDSRGNIQKPVPANIMVEKFEHNKIAYALLGFGIFSYMSAEEANRKMFNDWSSKELPAEKVLIPSRKSQGVVYFNLGTGLTTLSGSTLQIPLLNMRTGERSLAKIKIIVS